jgi:hypothetical protein
MLLVALLLTDQSRLRTRPRRKPVSSKAKAARPVTSVLALALRETLLIFMIDLQEPGRLGSAVSHWRLGLLTDLAGTL